MDYSRPERADALAADYVTGTLRGAARRRFEALLPAHPTLRRAVQAWQARLLPLTLSVTPVRPSPAVWKRIEARIAESQIRSAPARGLSFWRGLAGFASVAALALAGLLATPEPVRPPVVIVLNATEAAAGTPGGTAPGSIVASISGDGRAVVTQPVAQVAVQPDRVLELWAVPGSGAPRSLGLISASGATVVPKAQQLKGAAALAVSLEPTGGSPTGAPTGPVLYVGKLTL